MKTNAARYLDTLGIHYELREYALDTEDFSAILVAEKIGLPPEQAFKTLLCVTNDKEHVFAIVPGNAELDFKKLAHAAGARKAEMVSLKEVQPLTGYIRGGVTVFGAKKSFPVYVDETVILFDKISVSAGARGTQLILAPEDYLKAAAALDVPVETVDLTKASSGAAAGGARRLGEAGAGEHQRRHRDRRLESALHRVPRIDAPRPIRRSGQRARNPALASKSRPMHLMGIIYEMWEWICAL